VNGDRKNDLSSPVTHHLSLLILFVHSMAAAAATKLFQLKPSGRVLLVLRRHVITLFALSALQNYVISRHKSSF
jgi:hypothetical protein